jgi:hypothetical protein
MKSCLDSPLIFLQGKLCVIGRKLDGTFLMRTQNGKYYWFDNEGAVEFDDQLAVTNLLANANMVQRLVLKGVIAGIAVLGYDTSSAEWKPT